MSERTEYPAGVPCFVDTLTPDLEAAKRFYGAVFGWEFAGPGPMPDMADSEYHVARLRGHDVAAVGSLPAGGPPPAWNTYVSVASVDESAARAQELGATVVAGPFDAPPAGRMAVLADPSGATFSLWQPGTRNGAGLVNEPSAWAMSMLSTDDPQRAEEFYSGLFGWTAHPFEAGPGIQAWLWRLPGYLGGEPQQPVPRDVVAAMMPLPTGADGPPPNWGVDFWIADADAAAATAPEYGGAVIAPAAQAGMFKRTVLRDPHGAVFSASQLMLDG